MNRKKWLSLWPAVGDEQGAVLAARQGFHAAVYCSIVTAIFAVLGGFGFKIMDFDLWNLTDAALMALLAFGIRRMSRTAALIALLYYVAGRIDLWAEYGSRNPVIAGIFVLMFLSAVRGTFAYHHLKPRPEVLNLVPAVESNEHISIGTVYESTRDHCLCHRTGFSSDGSKSCDGGRISPVPPGSDEDLLASLTRTHEELHPA